jgi:hypothetical protein
MENEVVFKMSSPSTEQQRCLRPGGNKCFRGSLPPLSYKLLFTFLTMISSLILSIWLLNFLENSNHEINVMYQTNHM